MATVSPVVLSYALHSLQSTMQQFISTVSYILSQPPQHSPHQSLPQFNPLPPLPVAFPHTFAPSQAFIPSAFVPHPPAAHVPTGGVVRTPFFSQIAQVAHKTNPLNLYLSSKPPPLSPPSEKVRVKIRSLQNHTSQSQIVRCRYGDHNTLRPHVKTQRFVSHVVV
jgi:hypothetical protein